MRVAVIGGNGQLGQDVCAAFSAAKHDVVALTHADLEVSSYDSVKAALEHIRPDLVINTAAFHNVDRCEAEPDPAFTVNALGARNVASVADSTGAVLIHISTDYVFDGLAGRPYVEQDAPAPLNVYGNSKVAGEFFVRSIARRYFLVRVSGIYGQHPCRAKGGLNFVEMMLKLARERGEVRVVDNEIVTPTPTAEIAKQLLVLSGTTDYGIYHASSEGSCSWYEFASAIFELSGTRVKLDRAQPGEFPARAKRPQYSVLENKALKDRSLNIFTHWKNGLSEYLKHRQTAESVITR
jgi:dTDP-4-dehydrorhamnose reductase